MKKTVLLSLLVSVLFHCSKPTASVTETDTGTISGWVVDDQNSAVENAEVILRTTKSRADTTTTSNDGYFLFNSVDTGTYHIEINAHDSLGALLQATVAEDEPEVETGTITVTALGVLRGSVNLTLTSKQPTYLYLVALDREVPLDSLGHFLVNNIPQSNYAIKLVTQDTTITSPLDTVTLSVTGLDTTSAFNLGTESGSINVKGTIHE